jgi:hypothetical protein
MKRTLLSIAAASMLVASVGIASAQNENPTQPSWTTTQGETLTTTYRSMHYTPYADPSMHPQVGMVLPNTVKVYPLPDGMSGAQYSGYSYGMVNDQPVVVVTTTRKVVHTWN